MTTKRAPWSNQSIGDVLGINPSTTQDWVERFGKPLHETEQGLRDWVNVVLESGYASKRSAQILRDWLEGKDTREMPKLTVTLLAREFGIPSSIVRRLELFRRIKRIPNGSGWFLRKEALLWAKLVSSSCHLRLMSEHIELISSWVESNQQWIYQKDE